MKKLIAVVIGVIVVLLFITGCGSHTECCPECGGNYRLVDHTRITSNHKEAREYYYYTYGCVECGHEYTITIVE